jgi:twitching motility protein PilT
MAGDNEPDAIVAQLNASTQAPARAAESAGRIESWLRLLVDSGGSDLLLVGGEPPVIRLQGSLKRLDEAVLDGDDVVGAVLGSLPLHAQQEFRSRHIADAGFRLAGVGRFRVNLHQERGRPAASIRALPRQVPELRSLRLPDAVEQLTKLARGLVLIGGATGSGKTTTVAALVNEINRREARHIVTIEDPIEYEHQNVRSVIEQVEIGTDAPDFPTALRSALRQAPDVIVIGEMRDPETMNIALAAGETGHLVFSTLHTSDPPGTGDGAHRRVHADAAADGDRGPRPGSRTADAQLRRAPAHSKERRPAPASGDCAHAQARIIQPGRIAGETGQTRPRAERGGATSGEPSRRVRTHPRHAAVGRRLIR